MNKSKLDPSQDAGKFAYHLRKLGRTSLIARDEKTKKYKITPLGEIVADFTKSLDEYAIKEGEGVFVRTSKLVMEEFDRNRIAEALIKEAGMSTKLASAIAEEVEERLLKLDVTHLTSSLIREFVNVILIEKGFQEYRHKLVRLGLPVYDVTQLINATDNSYQNVEAINKAAGESVLKGYTLLNVLPRSIADAYLSGMIHINNISSWILKPNELQHDLRPFLQKGFRSIQRGSVVTFDPPNTFEAAISLTYNLIETSRMELAGEQAINYFNIILAPFVQGLSKEAIKRTLHLFILSLNTLPSSKGWPTEVTIGVDPSIPKNFEEANAFGPNGKLVGSYGDYFNESQTILDSLLDIFCEGNTQGHVFTSNLIFNIGGKALKSGESESLLLKVHELSAKNGKPYFANLVPRWQKDALYFATGTRLASDWTKDWEIDTVRTGNLDIVVINLPRLAYEAQGNDNRFFELLEDRVKMAIEALQIKNHMIQDRRRRSLLPFLFQRIARKTYFRLKNASNLVSFIGLNEAVKIHTGDSLYGAGKNMDFAVKIIKNLSLHAKKLSQKLGLRILVSQVPSSEAAQRLAGLDVEKYGWGVVNTQGTKEAPYYTDLVAIPLEAKVSLEDRLQIESELHPLTLGGHLSIIELEEPERDPENLLKMTKKICRSHNIGVFTYTRSFSYCKRCRRGFGGHPQKCPNCKSTNSLTYYSRQSAKYKPIKYWTAAKKATIGKRVRYSV
ncbi:MAG: anaerobic ribonucleoside-triphosphate reductase [Candidatus Bathyarchaeota archaeon]|nr:anaerobic ribonucleoside-triphosphate reductase [Candidatus Bathyarchaeota archaeon]